jgi:hypothetical protein
LLPFRPWAVPVTYVPMTLEPHPLPDFQAWLAGALMTVRGGAGV